MGARRSESDSECKVGWSTRTVTMAEQPTAANGQTAAPASENKPADNEAAMLEMENLYGFTVAEQRAIEVRQMIASLGKGHVWQQSTRVRFEKDFFSCKILMKSTSR
jgi:hypothetical protein